MSFRFCSFASGSSGNCYMVRTDSTVVLVDVGIAGKRIIAGLEENGLGVEDVDGILVTHEHVDHVKSIKMLGRKASHCMVYGSAGTLGAVEEKLPEGRSERISKGQDFQIGDIQIHPFALSHDAAEPLGYTLKAGGRQVTVVTDTGCFTEDIMEQVRTADLLVLEANHEVNILRMGSYPYPLQQRILGDHGHLSNETCARGICDMLANRLKHDVPKVLLAHLSKENNTPQQAYLTVRNVLFEEGYYEEQDVILSVLDRDKTGEPVEV